MNGGSSQANAPRPSIGVIGLGQMGARMARVLASKGWHVVGWDLSPAARAALAGSGVDVVETVAEVAAGTGVVLTSLPDGTSVRSVALGQGGLSSVTASGLLIDLSTTARRRRRRQLSRPTWAERGWVVHRRPGQRRGRRGRGGHPDDHGRGRQGEAVERARPVLDAISAEAGPLRVRPVPVRWPRPATS